MSESVTPVNFFSDVVASLSAASAVMGNRDFHPLMHTVATDLTVAIFTN